MPDGNLCVTTWFNMKSTHIAFRRTHNQRQLFPYFIENSDAFASITTTGFFPPETENGTASDGSRKMLFIFLHVDENCALCTGVSLVQNSAIRPDVLKLCHE